MRPSFLLFFALSLQAQLIPNGQPVPKGPNPPVVFVNGYQPVCAASSFSGTFGNADQVLQANQTVSLFFNNCSFPSKPPIETLGLAFGQYLASLRYTDGSVVGTVDVVAHSMGGLIVRSYLAGKQDITPAVFSPPANTGIRKIVFLATPNFGTQAASLFGSDQQTAEMAVGSQFLFDLNTWNNGTDDLRGRDAIAVAGDGGTGVESKIPGFDDGVVTLTSSSLTFYRPGRTQVLLVCHTSDPVISALNLCQPQAPPIAQINDASNPVGQIIVSFLSGTNTWMTIGTPIENDPVASKLGGIYIQAEDANGNKLPISSATVAGTINLQISASNIAFSEALNPNISLPIQVQSPGAPSLSISVTLPATTDLPVVAKPGPVITRAIPAASAVFPYAVAPGAFVAVYGSNPSTVTQSASPPYPLQLGGVQVLVNGTAVPINFVSSAQINIVYPLTTTGFDSLTVVNSTGKYQTSVITMAAVPSVFSLDSTGTGPAAAINGITGQILIPGVSLHAGDFLTLFLTGLGQTAVVNGFNQALIVPTVAVGGMSCKVTYAGRAGGFDVGLDQINCQIPPGIAPGNAVPVVVTSNGVNSNITTVAIQ